MRRYILLDLDDTLCDTSRREHLIQQEGWDAFHAKLGEDPCVEDVRQLVQSLSSDQFATSMEVIGLTARPAKWRQSTMAWLVKHEIMLDEVIMRPDDDFRASPVIKVALAAERFGGEDAIKDHVALVIDDRDDVCKAFAGLGVTVMQIYARRGAVEEAI